MLEVEIFNYQSIAHTKLKVEGFTALVGRNHLGKSAVLRAINAALTNQQGTDFIRWGEKYCEVRIRTSDIYIIWHKEEGNNYYEIKKDGEKESKKYTKIGRDEPPKEVLDAGFKLVKVGDQKINLNYAQQFKSLFLVDKQDTKSADLLTSVYGLDKLYMAIELCNKEQKSNKDLLRFREKDLQILGQGLKSFDGFEDIIAKSDIIKKEKKEVDKLKSDYTKLRSWKNTISDNAKYCKRLKPALEVCVPKPESLEVLKDTVDLIKYLSDSKRRIDSISTVLKSICPINNIEVPEDISSDISRAINDYNRLVDWSRRQEELDILINKLESAASIPIPKCEIDRGNVYKLNEYRDKLRSLKSNLEVIKNDFDNTKSDLIKVEEKIGEFDECPLCGHELQDKE